MKIGKKQELALSWKVETFLSTFSTLSLMLIIQLNGKTVLLPLKTSADEF